ncbi:hypothetical protein BGX34_010710 [Mortierella sp. NVP85]|nr:hypothetical protein BGX34_010710 [Mortierella sp. NVP85]
MVSSSASILKIVDQCLGVARVLDKTSHHDASHADSTRSNKDKQKALETSSSSSPSATLPNTSTTKGDRNDKKSEGVLEILKKYLDDVVLQECQILSQLQELSQNLDGEGCTQNIKQLESIRKEILRAMSKTKVRRVRSHPPRRLKGKRANSTPTRTSTPTPTNSRSSSPEPSESVTSKPAPVPPVCSTPPPPALIPTPTHGPVPAPQAQASASSALDMEALQKMFNEGFNALWHQVEKRQNNFFIQQQQERGSQLQLWSQTQYEFSQMQQLRFLQTQQHLEYYRLLRLQQKEHEELQRLRRQHELEQYFQQQAMHQIYPNGQQPQLPPPTLAAMYPMPTLQRSPPPRVITSKNKKHSRSQQRKKEKSIQRSRKCGAKPFHVAHWPMVQNSTYWWAPLQCFVSFDSRAPFSPTVPTVPSIRSTLSGPSSKCQKNFQPKRGHSGLTAIDRSIASSSMSWTASPPTVSPMTWWQAPQTVSPVTWPMGCSPRPPAPQPQTNFPAASGSARRRPVRVRPGPEIDMTLATDTAIREWRYIPQHPDPVVAAMLAYADFVSAGRNTAFSFGNVVMEYGRIHLTECMRRRRNNGGDYMEWASTRPDGYRASGQEADAAFAGWRYVSLHPDPATAATLAQLNFETASRIAGLSFGEAMMKHGQRHLEECLGKRRGGQLPISTWHNVQHPVVIPLSPPTPPAPPAQPFGYSFVPQFTQPVPVGVPVSVGNPTIPPMMMPSAPGSGNFNFAVLPPVPIASPSSMTDSNRGVGPSMTAIQNALPSIVPVSVPAPRTARPDSAAKLSRRCVVTVTAEEDEETEDDLETSSSTVCPSTSSNDGSSNSRTLSEVSFPADKGEGRLSKSASYDNSAECDNEKGTRTSCATDQTNDLLPQGGSCDEADQSVQSGDVRPAVDTETCMGSNRIAYTFVASPYGCDSPGTATEQGSDGTMVEQDDLDNTVDGEANGTNKNVKDGIASIPGRKDRHPVCTNNSKRSIVSSKRNRGRVHAENKNESSCGDRSDDSSISKRVVQAPRMRTKRKQHAGGKYFGGEDADDESAGEQRIRRVPARRHLPRRSTRGRANIPNPDTSTDRPLKREDNHHDDSNSSDGSECHNKGQNKMRKRLGGSEKNPYIASLSQVEELTKSSDNSSQAAHISPLCNRATSVIGKPQVFENHSRQQFTPFGLTSNNPSQHLKRHRGQEDGMIQGVGGGSDRRGDKRKRMVPVTSNDKENRNFGSKADRNKRQASLKSSMEKMDFNVDKQGRGDGARQKLTRGNKVDSARSKGTMQLDAQKRRFMEAVLEEDQEGSGKWTSQKFKRGRVRI